MNFIFEAMKFTAKPNKSPHYLFIQAVLVSGNGCERSGTGRRSEEVSHYSNVSDRSWLLHTSETCQTPGFRQIRCWGCVFSDLIWSLYRHEIMIRQMSLFRRLQLLMEMFRAL